MRKKHNLPKIDTSDIPEVGEAWFKKANLAVPSLNQIRQNALEGRARTDQIIAELDAWRNEIDATLAFLKAQRK